MPRAGYLLLRMAQQTSTTEQVRLRIGAVMSAQGRKQSWLSEQSGIPGRTLQRLLKGETAFNLNQVDNIAKALGMSTSDLLEDAELVA